MTTPLRPSVTCDASHPTAGTSVRARPSMDGAPARPGAPVDGEVGPARRPHRPARPRVGPHRGGRGTARFLGLSLLSAAALACGDATPEGTPLTATVRDSAGVTVVENPPVPLGAGGWTVGPEPTLEIGVLDGPEEYQLFRVRGAMRLDDGRWAVLNMGSSQVRIYAPDGAWLESWGGEGEGPGEFMGPQDLTEWQGDSVAVWDGRTRRVTVFGQDGALGRSFTLPSIEDMEFPGFTGVLADGSVLVNAMTFDGEPRNGLTRPEVRLAAVAPDGSSLGSLGSHPGQESYMQVGEGMSFINIVRFPFSRGYVLEPLGTRVVMSPNERFELKVWAIDGSLERIVRLAEPGRATTEADRTGELQRRLDEAPEERHPGIRRMFEELPMPDTLPAMEDVVEDAAGNLWVKRFRMPLDPGPADWIVLDSLGQAIARVEVPAELNIYEIGPDYLVGRTTDDFDVERVQVWPLRRDS